MEKRTDETRVGRRDFLSLSARAVATLLTMPVLQACKRLGWIDESGNPTSSASQDVHSTATPVATLPRRSLRPSRLALLALLWSELGTGAKASSGRYPCWEISR